MEEGGTGRREARFQDVFEHVVFTVLGKLFVYSKRHLRLG